MAESRELKVVPSASSRTVRVCLLVVGMHRSGTSALTRALNLLGAEVPCKVLGAEPHNEAGHWEPERIVAIHEEMLFRADSRWDDWRALTIDDLSARDRRVYKSTLARLIAEEYGTSRLFVLKDPRICRFIPLYEELLHSMRIEPRFLLPFRNPLEVAASLKARDQISQGYAGLLWLRHTLDAEHATRGKARTISRYEDLMADHKAELNRIGRELSLIWPNPVAKAAPELEAHFQEGLKHQEASDIELYAAPEMPVWVKDAFDCMIQLKSDPNKTEILERLDGIRLDFEAACVSLGVPAFSEFVRREANWLSTKNELETSISAHRREIDALLQFKSRSEALTEQLANADVRIAELAEVASEIQASKARLFDVSEQLKSTAAEREAALAEISSLSEQAQRAAEEKAKQQVLMESLKAERDNIQAVADARSADIDLLREEADRSLAALAQRDTELQLAANDLNAASEFLEAALADPRGAAETGVSLSFAGEDMRNRLQRASEALYRRDERISETEERLLASYAEGDYLKGELIALESKYAALSTEISSIKQGLAIASEQAITWEHRFVETHNRHSEDVRALTSSTSWKLTRPLRGIKRVFGEPAFRRSMLKGAARRVFIMLPLSQIQKQDLYRRYSRWRQERVIRAHRSPPKVVAAPEPAQLQPAEAQQPRPEARDGLAAQFPDIPSDGRWHPEHFETNKAAVQAMMTALRQKPSSSPLAEQDVVVRSVSTGPLVSLIVRTYGNRKALLARSLKSIADQAYRPIEVIVVDDGSETSPDVVSAFKGEPGCTFRIEHIAKLGRSAAANYGLEAARGELIGFLDDDDYLLEGHLPKLVALACADPELDAVYAGALELAADLNPATGLHSEEVLNAVFLRPIANSSEIIDRNPFPIQSALFRKSVLGKQDRFDLKLDALEDWLFWMRLLCGRKIGGISDVTSAFYVPRSTAAHARRIESHIAAEPYFLTQRNAMFEERRLTDLHLLHSWTKKLYQSAKARAVLPLSNMPLQSPQYPGAKRLESTIRKSVVELGLEENAGKVVAFTSINLRYLPKALAWAKSVKVHNPDWQTHILLNDALPDSAASWPNIDKVFPVSALNVPGYQSWAFGLRVVEFCTATKPFYAKRLLEAGFAHVFFFDPDTFVYSDLNQLVEEFGDNEVLITPHCAEDAVLDAEIHYNEISSLAHGIYNLGFLGLRNGPDAHNVIDFWCRRLLRYCVDDHARGLFTDQKWFNFVPVFFDRVKILKHRGCNTASWNIARRPISVSAEKYFAGGDPLIFFHFSGYDKNVPRRLFDIFGRFDAPLEGMIEDYDRQIEHFASKFLEWKQEWSLARYSNGEVIPDAHREIYRSNYQYQLVFDEPFITGELSFQQEVARMGPERLDAFVAPSGYLKRFY